MMSLVYNLVYYMTLPFTAFHTLVNGIPGLRKLGKISLPTRVAILVFVFLLIVLLSFVTTFLVTEGMAEFKNWLGNFKGLIVLVLMIIIPIVAYFITKIWMEEDSSEFPDIDKAWKQGSTELDKHGISLGSTPLFLIVGNSDERRAENLMRASGFGFNVHNPAEGPAAIHWFANPDGIFIFLTQSSCLSKLADQCQNRRDGMSQIASSAPPPIPGGQTIVAGAGQESLISERLDSLEEESPEEAEPKFMDAPAGMAGNAGIGATMDFSNMGDAGATMNFGAEAVQTAAKSSGGVRQSKSDLTDQMKRLEYVCKLINKARRPVCPINGILVTVPFELIDQFSEPVQIAIQSDLETIRETTRLRCSVTALVTEMDKNPGFLELIRRVGEKKSKEQRFGKGFNLWNPPIAEQLEAVSQHATGAFEDWTYLLFRERDGLRRPGNPKLFELLCKIRGSFSDSFTNIVANSFGYEPDKNPRASRGSLLFSGCYFAATGDSEDRQAFVRSVLYRVMEQDGELDWNAEALEENNSAEFASNIAALIGGVCLIILVAIGLNAAFGDSLPWNAN